jgi:DNA transformation protein and related proteins
VGDRAYLLDLFAQYGPIRFRRMFGAEGLFAGDLMIGFADDDMIYLKTDDTTRPDFEAEGCKPFVYRKRSGEEIVMSYWRIPDRLYDDPEEFAQWARKATGVAQRSHAAAGRKKPPATKKRSPARGARPCR